MATNLPANTTDEDSAAGTKIFFNDYGTIPMEFNAVDVDTTIAFFKKAGFADDAATSVATVLLTQAKIEKISIFSILDSIKSADNTAVSIFVAQVLNNNRVPTSVLGFRQVPNISNITRNIVE